MPYEALARYSVSREVPRSVLKSEKLLGTLDATPKVPRHTRKSDCFPKGNLFVNTTFHEKNLKKYCTSRNQNSMKIALGSKFYNVEVKRFPLDSE